MPRGETQLKTPRFIVLASVCVVIAALYFAQDVLMPLALAVLLSFLLSPLVLRLERVGLHRAPAVLVVMTFLLAILGVLAWAVYIQMQDLAEQLPSYRSNIVAKVQAFRGSGGGALSKAAQAIEEVKEAVAEPTTQTTQPAAMAAGPGPAARLRASTQPVPVTIIPSPTPKLSVLESYIGSVLGPLGTAGIVIVFVIFMLLQREDLRDRIIRLIGEGQLNVTTQALDDAATRISRYLLAQAIVNGTYGIAISVGLLVIGLTLGDGIFPSFVLWGLLCATLRFIPYIGPWIGAAFPIALSFAVYPGYGVFLAVSGMFVVVELLSNNLMEPWLYGASTGMSTVAILVAAVFWTWLWGPIGLLMATPLTVCIVVMGKYVPQLRFLDILLGDEPVLEPWQRMYQRLLAMDPEEATELAEEYLEKESLEEVYETVLLPALSMAEQDRHSGKLDDRRTTFIRQTLRELIDELEDQARRAEIRRSADETLRRARDEQAPAPENGSPRRTRPSIPTETPFSVVCLPAHDEADELVGLMLAQLLNLRGYTAYAASQNALASEMLLEVERRQADIVCVSALPPAAITHARYLCKRLRARFPDEPTVVGLWTIRGDLSKAKARIAPEGDISIASSLTRLLDLIDEMSQPLILRKAESKTPAATTQ